VSSRVAYRKSLEAQVREIRSLVSDATRNLEQIAYALRTLEERLEESEEDPPEPPSRGDLW
jgi:hypothetical protein